MKNLNKKGFTLVELLAVIVILGVIMLIAIPSVGTIIKNSKENSFASSGNMYISTAQNFIAGETDIVNGETYYMSIYELNNKKLDKSPIDSSRYITGYVTAAVDSNSNITYKAYICETAQNPGSVNNNTACDNNAYYAQLDAAGDRTQVKKGNGTEKLPDPPNSDNWKTTKWKKAS